MPPDDKNNDRRERARQALGGGRARKTREPGLEVIPPVKLNLPPEELAKKRIQAQAAMEGYERRERRKTKEAAEAARLAAQKRLATDLEAKRLAAEEATHAKEQAERERLSAEAAAKKKRLEQISQAERVIQNIKQSPTVSLKAIHTFQTDAADGARDGRTMKQMTAEINQSLSSYRGQKIDKQKIKIVASLAAVMALIVLVFGSSYWWLYLRPVNLETPAIKIASLLPAENYKELFLTGRIPLELRTQIYDERAAAFRDFKLTPAGGGPLLNLYPTEALAVNKETGAPENKIQVGLSRYLAALDLALPADFRLALEDNFMVGIYQAARPSLFYVFKIGSYERASTGLAAEESILLNTLFSPLLNDLVFTRNLRDLPLQSEIIDNIETRLIKDEAGQVVVLYAFLDDKTLVMTENVEAFQKILGLYRTPLPAGR